MDRFNGEVLPRSNHIYAEIARDFGKNTTAVGIFTAINKNYFDLRKILQIPINFKRNVPQKIDTKILDESYRESEEDSDQEDQENIDSANRSETMDSFFTKIQWDEINLRKHYDGKRYRTVPSKGWTDIVNAAVFALFKLTCKFTYKFKNVKTLGEGLCKECGNLCIVNLLQTDPISDEKYQKIEVTVTYGQNFAMHTKKRFISGNEL